MADSDDQKYYKSLSDFDLEYLTRRWIASAPQHKLALQEIIRRKNKREQKDRSIQVKIKKFALWTLIVSIVVLLFTLIQFFYSNITSTESKQVNRQVQADGESASAIIHANKFMNRIKNIGSRATVVVTEVKRKSRVAGLHY